MPSIDCPGYDGRFAREARCLKSRGRKPTLFDLAILIAMIAVALRLVGNAETPHFSRWVNLVLFQIAVFLPCCLFSSTLGCLIVYFRNYHPPLGLLARQPGLIACIIASNVSLLLIGLHLLFGRSVMDPDYFVVFPFLVWTVSGLAVAAGWLIQAASGFWEPGPTWIDLTSRLIGILWVTGAVFFLLVMALHR